MDTAYHIFMSVRYIIGITDKSRDDSLNPRVRRLRNRTINNVEQYHVIQV